MQESKQLREIIVCKDREQTNTVISDEWRKGRKQFFCHELESALKGVEATQTQRYRIEQLFTKQKQSIKAIIQIKYEQLGILKRFREQIQQLQQRYNFIEDHYRRTERQCQPIIQILKLKYSTLKVIKIQYEQMVEHFSNYYAPYSISCFQLFRVIHNNQQLDEVSIKGVQISHFQQFTKLMNKLAINQFTHQDEELNWIKKLCPSNNLKLSISMKIQFLIQRKDETLSQIKNLGLFRKFFSQVSDITVIIRLGTLRDLHVLKEIWRSMEGMKRMRVKMLGTQGYHNCIYNKSASYVRKWLFEGIVFLTEIVQLSFEAISFSPQVSTNDFLAMEESLVTLLTNNTINYLKISGCFNFPLLPRISALQQICLQWTSFRKQYSFISQASQSNLSLRSIKCQGIAQQSRIDGQLFNQLQNLIVENCNQVTLTNIVSSEPSKIKHLRIKRSSVGNVDSMANIFPKLINITSLVLQGINFRYQLLCTIPSPNLERIIFFWNQAITDQCMRQIDGRWPGLKSITLRYCRGVTERAWSICKFAELLELRIDELMLGKEKKALQYLKKQGIKVDYY